jgi:hypothetical protein
LLREISDYIAHGLAPPERQASLRFLISARKRGSSQARAIAALRRLWTSGFAQARFWP